MDRQTILEALEIRYVDLKFILTILENTKLPRNKCSALRGGMGQMLLRQNCVRDQKCEICDFERECIVRRTMYSQFEIQPKYATRGDSIGYVIECQDQKEYFKRGEQLEFHLLLYGKTIVYFTQFFQAFFMLGQYGLGKEKAKYQISQVMNEKDGLVADSHNLCIQNLGICTIAEYVLERKMELSEHGCENIIEFQTPVTLKYQGTFLKQFQEEAIARSVIRRIYSFDCFEENETPMLEMDENEELPKIVHQQTEFTVIPRYSSTTNGKMELKGICGEAVFDYLSEEMMMILLAGEKLHIGKNTSFGFGKYILR